MVAKFKLRKLAKSLPASYIKMIGEDSRQKNTFQTVERTKILLGNNESDKY
jgi:hypothetical protein